MPAAFAPIAALDVFFISIMAILMLVATYMLIQLVANVIAIAVEQVPVVGGDIAGAIRDAVGWLGGHILGLLSSTWNNVSGAGHNSFHAAAESTRTATFWSAYALAQVANGVIYLAHNVAGNAFATTVSWVQQSLTSLEQWTANTFNQEHNNIVGWVQGVYQTVTAWAGQEIRLAENYTARVADTLAQDVTYLEQRGDQLYTQATDYAQNVFTEATSYAQTIVTDAENALNDEIQQSYSSLAQTITDTQTWVQGEINQTTDYINQGITGVTTTITSVILPTIAAIEGELKQCLRPMCNNGPDFFQGFKLIEELLTGFALAELITAAVRDPEGTAHQIAGEVEDIISLPRSVLHQFVGS